MSYSKVVREVLILPIMCGVICCAIDIAPVLASGGSNAPIKTIQGSVTENEMIDNLERVGIKCVFHQGSAGVKGYLAVGTVRMGSSAFYKGVEVGDKIKALATADDLFTLQIERNGQPYQLQLKALLPTLASANSNPSPLLGVTQPKIPLVNVAQSKIPVVEVTAKDREKKLIQYDIELIIDITGSMSEKDGTGNLTKFEWCHDQIRDFAKLMAEYNRTMTITTFNTTFNTEEHCNPNRVEEIYDTIRPQGDTCLVTPLIDRLENIFHHKRA